MAAARQVARGGRLPGRAGHVRVLYLLPDRVGRQLGGPDPAVDRVHSVVAECCRVVPGALEHVAESRRLWLDAHRCPGPDGVASVGGDRRWKRRETQSGVGGACRRSRHRDRVVECPVPGVCGLHRDGSRSRQRHRVPAGRAGYPRPRPLERGGGHRVARRQRGAASGAGSAGPALPVVKQRLDDDRLADAGGVGPPLAQLPARQVGSIPGPRSERQSTPTVTGGAMVRRRCAARTSRTSTSGQSSVRTAATACGRSATGPASRRPSRTAPSPSTA